ncbi:MAG: hypothetical protein AAGD28_22715 [Bacteroidota bacterium]
MSAQEKQSRILNYLREAKLEMSRKEVQGLIEKLPHLPLPKGGHPLSIRIGLNLNTIIMNSILIVSVLSGLIYFSQLDEKPNLAPEVDSVEESIGENELPYREIDTREIESLEVLDLDQENISDSNPETPSEPESHESPEENLNSTLAADEPTTETTAAVSSNETPVSEPEPASRTNDQQEENLVGSERMRRSFKGTHYYNHNSPVKISEEDIKVLKKDLLKQLKADGFAKGRKVKLAIQCLPDGLRINTERLSKAQAQPYEAFLQKYSIPTATQRQIRLIEKYILIGDFDKDGDMLRGTLQGSGEIVLDKLDPIEEYYPLFSDKEENGLMSDLSPCQEPLNVDNSIGQLKQKLKSMLRSDDLFSSRKDETRIWFPKEGIAVNNNLIPEAKRGEYLELLREYGIKPCAARIIQMTSDYMAVGDMVNGKFKGRIHGAFDLDDLNNIKLKESILD